MPVIIRFKNLKFYIYPSDHGNAHVHVVGPGAEAKIFLKSLTVKSSVGFSEKTLKQIVKKVSQYQDILLENWELYHGKEEN